ncbi:histone acetyltransferase, MYST superfamily [Pisolithus croceorrhizus]|nr:histone acetyltransferase, MYST superfamily [Pisolithus croceorrhizus]
MVSAHPSHEGSQEPAPITPGGTYSIQSLRPFLLTSHWQSADSSSLETVSVGCKLFVRRPTPDGGEEERLAEILSIRDKHANSFTRRSTAGNLKEEEQEALKPEDRWEYFVHWDQFNKRLDEWVVGSRLVLSRDLEWPRPKPPQGKKTGLGPQKAPGKAPRSQSLLKKATANAAAAASPTPFSTPGPKNRRRRRRKKRKKKRKPEEEDLDAEGEMDVDAEGELEGETYDLTASPTDVPPSVTAFSKEQEIEKLRTSGSMTQSISEVARVKNLNRLQIGKHELDAWYFSPYPREYAHLPVLYICEFCLSYFPSSFMLARHRHRCTLLHPPGNEIYRHDDISFFELDGKRQLTWCRNLSLLSKCFLDHKTLYYDVTPFMYYVMTQRDANGCHIIGYFSKEKESAENYNVACILTLPQYQRHGFGKVLIEFSYELSKKEGKLGSPEKPLSDLGLLSYRAYWAEVIVEVLLNTTDDISIDDIAQRTSITHADIMNTCTTLQLFKHYKGQHIICLSDAVLEKHEKTRNKRRRRIHSEHLIWKPPVFTRDQLRFY